MILVTKEVMDYGLCMLCNDGKLRDFAMFGNMRGCVRIYRKVGHARVVASRIGGQVAVIPEGMKVEAGGCVIESVLCAPPPGETGEHVRNIQHKLGEFLLPE
jgi:hypothetical protein